LRPYKSESSPKIGDARNCIRPKSAVISPAMRYLECSEYPERRNEEDVGSVKREGMTGISIPTPIISRRRVRKRTGSIDFLCIRGV
jgi:hypothetical protein